MCSCIRETTLPSPGSKAKATAASYNFNKHHSVIHTEKWLLNFVYESSSDARKNFIFLFFKVYFFTTYVRNVRHTLQLFCSQCALDKRSLTHYRDFVMRYLHLTVVSFWIFNSFLYLQHSKLKINK